jgi:O-antigen chain-terminating methyltransferase
MLDNIKQKLKAVPILGTILLFFYKSAKRFLRFLKNYKIGSALIPVISDMYNEIESYQPLYNCPVESFDLKRDCIDRCKTIEEALDDYGPKFRGIDLGCSLGYISFYFAERGAMIDAYDYDTKVAATAKRVQEFNRIPVNFRVGTLDKEFVNKIPDNTYNVAFILSVLHHVGNINGFTYVQQLLCELTNKIPIVFVELAIREEDVPHSWRNNLPNDPLETFSCCNNSEVTKIGEFPTHLSNTKRPLFMIKQKTIAVNGKLYRIDRTSTMSYPGSPGCNRSFIWAQDVFIKKHRICEGLHKEESLRQIIRELANFDFINARARRIPVLKDLEIKKGEITAVFERLDMVNLIDVIKKNNGSNVRELFIEILKAVAELRNFGLYHNDLRIWNIMVNSNKAFLVDLGHATAEESDNSIIALLQILWDMQNKTKTMNIIWPIKDLPTSNLADYDISVQDIAGLLLSSSSIDSFFSKFTFE